jgi:hypothetical protein
MKSVLKSVIWLYIAAACAYVFYEWYAYAGLYRLAAEWQLEHYGSYRMRLTLIVPLLVLLAPAAVLVSLTGMQDQLRSATQGGDRPRCSPCWAPWPSRSRPEPAGTAT